MKKTYLKTYKGMTLIELLLSISILGIIAVTFLPILTNGFVNISNSGKCVIVVSHSNEVKKYADRVLKINEGRVEDIK